MRQTIHAVQSDLLWNSMQPQLALPKAKPRNGVQGPSRLYVDIADGDLGLTAAVQSIDTLQMSQHKPTNSPTPTAFLKQVTCSNDGAFAPIDINSLDSFPMDRCSDIIPLICSGIKDTLPCTYLDIAAQVYFIDEWTANLLNMLSSFDILTDKTSFPSTFKLMLAFIRYLLHRGSLSSFDVRIHHAIAGAQRGLWRYTLENPPDEQIVALANLVEQVVHSPVFELESEWTGAQTALLDMYSGMVGLWSWTPGRSINHNSWPALRPLVEILINQYDALYGATQFAIASFDIMCKILGFGLRHGVETVYGIFLDMRCLEVFGSHSLRPWLVTVINGYVAGLAASDASIDLQRHLDYLHEPENLFLACCVLITNGWNTCREPSNSVFSPPHRLSEDICTDIRALASLRPSDPSWAQCRRKLRDLLQDDGCEFFVKQQKWTPQGFESLKPEAINEAKSNIRLALGEFDKIFSGSVGAHSTRLHGSMIRSFFGCMHRYLWYPRRRGKDDVQMQV
ncbi:hypothetical protein IW261DRAFT_498811 [Armillaria novae-zelandiae]|uniref:Uncharacterized protein n=1 Tax=Armillaria novae-zelandiae TaxID=153914 RepID=A0AA39P035_9AGAR|nr:hypothetical protein IW261DRAFT_498811 [Armillaria novae-zelandiae]